MTNEEFFDIGRVAYITGNVQEALAAKQALEKVVESANSLQQLQAKIRALVAETVESQNGNVDAGELLVDLLADLRVLSAM